MTAVAVDRPAVVGRVNTLWRVPRRSVEWMDWAACRECADPEIFWPVRRQGAHIHRNQSAAALAVCRICPVIDACLNYAQTQKEHVGIWGGMTERQRETLRRQHRKAQT